MNHSSVWQTVLNIVGISSLIGAVVAHFLSEHRERVVWIRENKKAEWREFMSEMHEALGYMKYAFWSVVPVHAPNDDSFDHNKGIRIGFRVIQSRIFIAEVLQRKGIDARWETLVQEVTEAPQSLPNTDNPHAESFAQKAIKFEVDLMETARQDLGIK